MRNAKYIRSTKLQSSYSYKDRWECPFCRAKGSPECRFNLSKKKRGKVHKCRFCGMLLKLKYIKK